MKAFVLFLLVSLANGEPKVIYGSVPDCSQETVAKAISMTEQRLKAGGYVIHDVDGECAELSVELPGEPA